MTLETGNDLKKWRKQNNMTQDELAQKINYSSNRIAHVESQNEKISHKMHAQLMQLKKEIDPEPPIIFQAWDKLLQKNAERNNFYNKEIELLEKSIVNIINSISLDHYKKSIDSCNLIIEYLNGYSKIMKLDYLDKDTFKQKSNHIYIGIRSKFLDFKYKK